jgi:hypothetical protein
MADSLHNASMQYNAGRHAEIMGLKKGTVPNNREAGL